MNTTAVVKKAREEALSSATIGREDLDQVRSVDTKCDSFMENAGTLGMGAP